MQAELLKFSIAVAWVAPDDALCRRRLRLRTLLQRARTDAIRTDYAGHDRAYRKRRAEGKIGWDGGEAEYSERIAQFEKFLAAGLAPRGGRLLEIGCGAGNMSLWLAGRGYRVTGLEIAATAIAWAREKAREQRSTARFLKGSALELPFAGETFDFVLDGHCLHCIIGADRAKFLSEAFRVVRPGGFFLVDTMCGPVREGVLDGYDPSTRCTLFKDIATRYFGLREDLEAEVRAAGFEILRSDLLEYDPIKSLAIQARKADQNQMPKTAMG